METELKAYKWRHKHTRLFFVRGRFSKDNKRGSLYSLPGHARNSVKKTKYTDPNDYELVTFKLVEVPDGN